jgi:hypothetical protein
LDALESDDPGVQLAKEHYHGAVHCNYKGASFSALIFASTFLLSILEHDCTFMFADATFRTAPRPFSQIFNILVSYKGVVLPLFHIVMTGKPSRLYSKIFERIKTLFEHFSPINVNTDFEAGLMKAVKGSFPSADILGCRFHYAQAVFRAIMGPRKFINRLVY